MIEFGYRQGKTGRIAACGRTKTETTLHNVPAVVNATRAAGRLKIYFFARRLFHIGNIKIPRLTIEGGTPGIAHPECSDLAAGVSSIAERFARRIGIG